MVEKAQTPYPSATDWWSNIADPLRQFGSRIAEYFSPTADASAADDYYEINLELPGVSDGDIDITIHDRNLVVKGEKKSHHEEKGKTYYFSERSYGAFQRTFRLPGDADADKVTAKFKDGVLTVLVAKSKAEDKSKKIEINRG